MSLFPPPPGYVSALVALERANEEWGARDSRGQLVGLLIAGKLRTWKVTRSGILEEINPEAYRDETQGGRPDKYDWEAMWIKIAGWAFAYDDMPELNEAGEIKFRKRIQEWFSEEYGSTDVPSDDTLRPKVRKLFTQLKAANKAG
jgi:hypothetical protein